MNVLIIGGGKMGAQVTRRLLDENHQVCLVECRSEILERLSTEFPREIIFLGDGSSPSIMETAGIQNAQVLAAVTGDDEANLVISMLARFEFNVPRIIARVNNPKNAWLFTPEMGVDVALNQTDIFSSLILEEMSLGDMMTLLKLRRGLYSLVEIKLPPRSRALGIPIKDLPLPTTCVIAAVIRKGQVITPRGNLEFKIEDEILAVVDDLSKDEVHNLFAPEQA